MSIVKVVVEGLGTLTFPDGVTEEEVRAEILRRRAEKEGKNRPPGGRKPTAEQMPTPSHPGDFLKPSPRGAYTQQQINAYSDFITGTMGNDFHRAEVFLRSHKQFDPALWKIASTQARKFPSKPDPVRAPLAPEQAARLGGGNRKDYEQKLSAQKATIESVLKKDPDMPLRIKVDINSMGALAARSILGDAGFPRAVADALFDLAKKTPLPTDPVDRLQGLYGAEKARVTRLRKKGVSDRDIAAMLGYAWEADNSQQRGRGEDYPQ